MNLIEELGKLCTRSYSFGWLEYLCNIFASDLESVLYYVYCNLNSGLRKSIHCRD